MDYTRLMKQSSLSIGLDLVLTLPSLALSSAQPLVWGLAPSVFAFLAHTWCTNVAGPPIPVYLLGHKLLHAYGFFPLNASNGLACVIFSYNQRITMTLVADMAIIPDVTELRDDLQNSFEALRRAAKVQPQPVVNKPRPEPAPEPEAASAAVTQETPSVTETAAPSAPEPAPVSLIVAGNGAQSAETAPQAVAVASSMSETQPALQAEAGEEPVTLFSAAWAQRYLVAINASSAYYNASTRWEAGSLTFILKPAPRHGYPLERAVWLDLHRGRCRDAYSLPPTEARERAAFVIEGEYDTWMDVLNGRAQPLPLIMRGKLRLSKGSLMRLMPFTQSAQELIKCAQDIT
jgi:putative sterol carrier protein